MKHRSTLASWLVQVCAILRSILVAVGIILSITLGIVPETVAQSLTVFGMKTDSFPRIKAKFYALDREGQPVKSIDKATFTITENGTPRTVQTLVVPEQTSLRALSTVLTIDISGSMEADQRIELAKAGATAWIETMALAESECAVTSFDDKSYVNQDFSHSAEKLRSAVAGLKSQGGTDYDKGFLDGFAGGLHIAKRGKHKRILMFLTDGLGGGSRERIIQTALKDSVTVYCVTLGMRMPSVLAAVAERTGGKWYENVSSKEEITAIYRRIILEQQNIQPGEIIWESGTSCFSARDVQFVWTPPAAKAAQHSGNYLAPQNALIRIAARPRSFNFRDVLPGNSQGQRITLTATGAPITITSIESNNPLFSVSGIPTPLTLKPGETRVLTVGFAPKDSSFTFARIDIRTNLCNPTSIYATGGFPGKGTIVPTLAVTAPVGGETLYSGADTVVSWTGIMPSEAVAVDYSVDGGTTWDTITTKASSLHASWRVPPVPATRLVSTPGRPMQLKVRQIWEAEDIEHEPNLILDTHGASLYMAKFSSDGTKIVTASGDGTAKIWDAYTGMVQWTFQGHRGIVASAMFNPDASLVVTASYDNTVRVWDVETGSQVHIIYGDATKQQMYSFHNASSQQRLDMTYTGPRKFLYAGFDNTGNRIFATTDNNALTIWRTKSPAISGFMFEPFGAMNSAIASPDNSYILTANSDFTIKLWSPVLGTPVRVFAGHTDKVFYASFHPSGNRIVSGAADNTARIWDTQTGKLLLTLKGHTADVFCAVYSPDGYRVATASLDGSIRIWNAVSGALLTAFTWGAGFHHVEFSPDGSRLLGAGIDGNAYVWDIGGGYLQEAVSKPFTVIAPKARLRENLNMGNVLVGASKDSVLTAVITNPDKSIVRVNDIRFMGADSIDFLIVSGTPPFDVPAGGSKSVEFRFAPQAVGSRSTTVEMITFTDTLRATLRGTGTARNFTLHTTAVDFGTVNIKTHKDTVLTAMLRNTGTAPLVIRAITRVAPDTAQFSLSSQELPLTLQPDESYTLGAHFVPTGVGRSTGGVKIDIVGVPKPVVVQFIGEGVSTPISGTVQLRGLNDMGIESTIDTLRVEEFRTTLVRPLLNYIFFEENSAVLPTRYLMLNPDETSEFHLERFYDSLANSMSSGGGQYGTNLQSYYHVLNIIGKRLTASPALRLKLTGCNADIGAERNNATLSRKRAEAVKQYLVRVWRIAEQRIVIQTRNKPERASNTATEEGIAENRRVEFIFEPQEGISPVMISDEMFLATPQMVRFRPAVGITEPVANWAVDLLSGTRIVAKVSGKGDIPTAIDYRLSSGELRALSKAVGDSAGNIRYRLRCITNAGQYFATEPASLPLRALSLQSKRRQMRTDELIERFALMFFDFDKITLNAQNFGIVKTLQSRVQPDTQLAVTGYTDILGDENYNKKLSLERAKSVADFFAGKTQQPIHTNGVGEAPFLFDNSLPEGRFYCRMVEITMKSSAPLR